MRIIINFLVLIFCFLTIACKDSPDVVQEAPDENLNESDRNDKGPLFTQLSSDLTGIQFENRNIENDRYNFYKYEYFYNGGGVAVADFNNDGLQDIYFTANMGLNKLYINNGNLNFTDITSSANVNSKDRDWCTGVTVVDINQDGWQDIFVSRSGWFKNENKQLLRNLLFINNGDLTFTERGLDYGFIDLSPTTQTCFFDSDNDGDLDVYQINHPTKFKGFVQDGKGTLTKVPYGEDDYSDRFYLNKNGKYIENTKALGLENSGHGLGVVSSDFNNDGWQDIYVANDYSEPDYLYMNQGNGKFKNEALSAFKHISKFSMGVDVADINNDGYQDIFNAEMLAQDNFSKKANMAPMSPTEYWYYVNNGYHYQDMHNSLQLNNGNGTFSEIAWLANIAETDWSWCPLFADFDNDGLKDLFVSNGYKRDVLSKDFSKDLKKLMKKEGNKKFTEFADKIPSKKVSNYIFKNKGNLTFSDQTQHWGIDLKVNSNGAAYADLDNDGDLDILVNNIDDKAVIYRNELNGSSNFLDIELVDDNNAVLGSKVEILDEGYYQVSVMKNTSGYQSVSESKIHFGFGDKRGVDSLLITWANGKRTLLIDPEINKTHKIVFDNSSITNFKQVQNAKPYFVDKSQNIRMDYVHKEQEYDDYLYEILLPHKLSQEGPYLDVADVNGDGLDDFYIGNGAGYAGKLYLQKESGSFMASSPKTFAQDRLCEDLGVLFVDFDNDGDKDLYVVSGSNEYELDSPFMQDRLYENDGAGNFIKTINVLPQMKASGSCVITSDYDKDGDMDLFIGGYLKPKQYPSPGSSYLLENQNGKYIDVTNKIAPGLQEIGMVKDAEFSDIDLDGKTDLVIAGHWMPIEIYINTGEKFENRTEKYGTSEEIGWWNSILIEDVDNDDYPDIIAGNLGMNSKHKATRLEPFLVYANDFDKSGTNDVVLGYYNGGALYPVRGKQCSAEQVPIIDEKIKSYNEFGQLNLEQIYGLDKLNESLAYSASNFKTSIFKNINGSNFEVKSLPNQVQFAPSNAIWSSDLNNDDMIDLVIIGNQHPVEVETGRYDAHIGNVLFNSGGMEFINQPSTRSGFITDGDHRDIGVIKIKDRNYLMISSNREKLKFIEIRHNE